MRRLDDLPAPFGPTNPVTRPGRASKLTASSIRRPPRVLETLSNLIMAAMLLHQVAASIGPGGDCPVASRTRGSQPLG